MIQIKLDFLLKEKNISLRELSRLSDIDYSVLHKYKNNKLQRYDKNILAKICKILDCKIEELLEIVEEEEK